MTWLFAVGTSVLLGTEIKNFLYSHWMHTFCLNVLTTYSRVLKDKSQRSYSRIEERIQNTAFSVYCVG